MVTEGCRFRKHANLQSSTNQMGLEAAFSYAEHIPTIRNIVENWEGDGVLVTRAKAVVMDENLQSELRSALNYYRPTVSLLHTMTASNNTISQAFGDLSAVRNSVFR